MKMPCKCHRFWSRICYISYRMQLWSTALCILLTTQVEALLTRHLAVCTSGRRSVEIANRESLRWTVFSRWEKSTPAASDIAIRWGLQKSWISENFTRFFPEFAWGLWGAPVFMLFLSNNGMTTICFRAMAANTLRGDCFWMAPCVTWRRRLGLYQLNLCYSHISLWCTPCVLWLMVDGWQFAHVLLVSTSLPFPKTDWLLRYTAKAGDVINGTGINEVCIQPAKLAGLGGDPVEGVEVGFARF